MHKWKNLEYRFWFGLQWSRKTLLTEFGAESKEMNNTKVVENFDIFAESIDTPL
jgi:hypothetical protein